MEYTSLTMMREVTKLDLWHRLSDIYSLHCIEINMPFSYEELRLFILAKSQKDRQNNKWLQQILQENTDHWE